MGDVMIQEIIVGLIVVAAGIYVWRKFFMPKAGGNACGGCSSCGGSSKHGNKNCG